MKLELSLEEARFLNEQLVRRITELDEELAFTERRQMQHALAMDVDYLTNIERRLAALIETASSAVASPSSEGGR
jgi:hypothetical protein